MKGNMNIDITKELNEILSDAVLQKLQDLDKELQKNRDKRRYKLRCLKPKIMILNNQKYEVWRRYYFDTLNNKPVYLLDKKLEIERNQHISNKDKQSIYEMAAKDKMTYSQIIHGIKNVFSKSSISRLVKQFKVIYEVDFEKSVDEYENIYIDLDDSFCPLRINNKGVDFKCKIVHTYQSRDIKTKKFINDTKTVLLNKCHMNSAKSTFLTIKAIREILEEYYSKDLSKYRLFFCGDGARYVRTIANYFGGYIVLDKFHLKSRIKRDFNYKNRTQRDLFASQIKGFSKIKKYYCNRILDLVEQTKVDEAIKLLNEFKNEYSFKTKEMNNLILHLKTNKDAIEIWKDPAYYGTFTETHVQQLVKSYYGNFGKCYSLETFINLLNANCITRYLK